MGKISNDLSWLNRKFREAFCCKIWGLLSQNKDFQLLDKNWRESTTNCLLSIVYGMDSERNILVTLYEEGRVPLWQKINTQKVNLYGKARYIQECIVVCSAYLCTLSVVLKFRKGILNFWQGECYNYYRLLSGKDKLLQKKFPPPPSFINKKFEILFRLRTLQKLWFPISKKYRGKVKSYEV